MDVNQETFSVSTQAPVSLPTVQGVTFNNAILTVSLDKEGKLSSTADASLTVNALPSQPQFAAGISLRTGRRPSWLPSPLSPAQTSACRATSAALFVATDEIKHFDPTTLGLGISAVQPFDLKPGVTALVAPPSRKMSRPSSPTCKYPYKRPGEAACPLAVSRSRSPSSSVTRQRPPVLHQDGAAVYLNSLSIAASAGGPGIAISASGEGYVVLPALPGRQTPTGLDVTLTGSLTQDDTGDLNLSFGFSLTAIAGDCGPSGCAWDSAFGIPGLQVTGLSAKIGLDIEEDSGLFLPVPTLTFTINQPGAARHSGRQTSGSCRGPSSRWP